MRKYYVRFNGETKNVDVFSRKNNLLIGSVQVNVNYGLINSTDLEQVAESLHIGSFNRDFDLLEFDIFNEWSAHQK